MNFIVLSNVEIFRVTDHYAQTINKSSISFQVLKKISTRDQKMYLSDFSQYIGKPRPLKQKSQRP